MLVDCPKDTWCAEASRVGVLLAAKVDLLAANATIIVRRLSRQAAVGMLDCDLNQQVDLSDILPDKTNCIIVQDMLTSAEATLHPRAQAILVDASSLASVIKGHERAILPVIACRRDQPCYEPAQIRPACDRLQADIAPYGDFAGYLV